MEFIQNILDTLKEAAPWLAIIGGSVVIEILPPVKIKPWSWVAKKIGKTINDPVIAKLNDIEARITELEATNNRQDAERAMDKALDARRRILQFADEVRRNVRHSQEHFNNVLGSIRYYEDYCHNHEEFKNDKALISIKIIRDTYEKCERENDFL